MSLRMSYLARWNKIRKKIARVISGTQEYLTYCQAGLSIILYCMSGQLLYVIHHGIFPVIAPTGPPLYVNLHSYKYGVSVSRLLSAKSNQQKVILAVNH